MQFFKNLKQAGLLTAGLLFASFTQAQMTLDESSSSLTFLSTKNVNIIESHTFDRFSGSITEDGKLTLTIDLASLNTLIPIRNERMLSMLFDVSNFATATFVAQIDDKLMAIDQGQSVNTSITGDLTISGKTHPLTFDVILTGLNDNRIAASTVRPAIINASQYELDAGIEALRDVAMLQNISASVPLTFYVEFN